MGQIVPQQVRWNPVDAGEPGIKINDKLIPWNKLVKELEAKLIPQVEHMNAQEYSIIIKDLDNKKNWLVRIVKPDGSEIGGIWFGPNPEIKGAPWDGLIRIGKSFNPPKIWNTFQRYSDGSYRRLANN